MFTPWLLDRSLVWAAIVTMLSIAGLFLLLRENRRNARKLTAFGLLYVVFAASLFFVL